MFVLTPQPYLLLQRNQTLRLLHPILIVKTTHKQASDGLHIDSAVIYGTPTAVGSFNNIIITASDGDTALGGTASAMLTLKVIPDYTVTSMSLPSPSNTITASTHSGEESLVLAPLHKLSAIPRKAYLYRQ